ncbi:MAG: imidazole glycerol phosphate synthase subunit HisF [Candidatus Yanofskybacteria bacterium RIFCSPHIGHO2_01_FULL_39_8b]|uniref:imidazole glycerol-phosphate synthase n=1 Tax=Candidatus Yanofskybacteria bacterium RIFCSPHIGHO2_01_FULL_39_8b TaxID=1802659 RepID=A0A1F8EGE2_9BACT|nr:MAG: imidazole glycerol phosphate synthase subunit HisF [Candidatus Yanofskybacteria bacterium RIFCSPHIGHO2_01_FULL_39_8b]
MNTTFKKIRIIPRLDVKGSNVIKGVHLECLKIVGNPQDMATRYYNEGADEIICMDIVASLYGRKNLLNIISEAAKNIFIPLTAGGGIKSIKDIKNILRAGADKVAINTYAVKNPDFIPKAAKAFGSQCIVGSIEAKLIEPGKWEAFTDNGREKTGLDVIKWAQRLEKLGAGELLITSVDKEGTTKGYDLELMNKITQAVKIPIIACGGAGSPKDFYNTATLGIDAIAASHVFHYQKHNVKEIKKYLKNKKINVRT